MRKKLALVIMMLSLIALIGYSLTIYTSDVAKENRDKIKIVTSFYPMYIAALNVVWDMDNVELINLTGQDVGCLHDYQLTPKDMVTLENADIFIINGGGIEGFIEDVAKEYPKLTIIDTSSNINLLHNIEYLHEEENNGEETSHDDEETSHDEEEDHDHDHQTHLHHDQEYNAHIWLSISRYIEQVKAITLGLIEYDSYHQGIYLRNQDSYINSLSKIKKQMENLFSKNNEKVVLFYEGFAYLADELGLDIKHMINMDSETVLSAHEVAEVINEINEYDIKVLFADKQYGEKAAAAIAKETNANYYILDTLVTGEYKKDSYIRGSMNNIEILKEVLSN